MSTQLSWINQHNILLCMRKQKCIRLIEVPTYLGGVSQQAYLLARRTAWALQPLAQNRRHQVEQDRE